MSTLLTEAAAFTAAADAIEAGDIAQAVSLLQEIGDYYATDATLCVALSGAAWRESEALPEMDAPERAKCVAYLREQAADIDGLAQGERS